MSDPDEPPRQHRLAELRATGLFLVGMAGLAHETVVRDAERPYLLAIFVACMGLPAFLPAINGRHKQ